MIECTESYYHIIGLALVNGEDKRIEYNSNERNAREARKFVAEKLGVKAAQVIVSIEPVRHDFEIDCGYEMLVEALDEADIEIIPR